MSAENNSTKVVNTLNSFEKLFDTIIELAKQGQIDDAEDVILSGIVTELHDLHEQFCDRILEEAAEKAEEKSKSLFDDAKDMLRGLVVKKPN